MQLRREPAVQRGRESLVHFQARLDRRDTALVADHPRAPDGARRRMVDPAHFAPLFPAKPRAQVMLYRQALLELGEPAAAFMTELSRRQRARLGPEVLAVYALLEEHGVAALLAAMARAAGAGRYSAEALGALLGRVRARPAIPPLALPGVPSQAEIDRPLSAYEALVQVDVAREEAVAPGAGR